MKSITRHTGKLEVISRLPSSVNGNPRFLATVDGYQFRTAVDSSNGYSIQNYDGRQVTVTLGSHYGVLTLNTIHSL